MGSAATANTTGATPRPPLRERSTGALLAPPHPRLTAAAPRAPRRALKPAAGGDAYTHTVAWREFDVPPGAAYTLVASTFDPQQQLDFLVTVRSAPY